MANTETNDQSAAKPEEWPPDQLILVVEDSLTETLALKLLLEKNGFRVLTARNGREALDLIHQHPVGLVISDINMPEMSGYEMCEAIKSDPRTWTISVILLTTLSNTGSILQGLKARADYYLTKPYGAAYLIEKIRGVLKSPQLITDGEGSDTLLMRVNGERHTVSADKRQILNFLLSTYENAVQQNRELNRVQFELKALNQQLRQQSERLRSSERDFRLLLENNVDAMLVIDARQHVRFANATARSWLAGGDQIVGSIFAFPLSVGQAREVDFSRPDGTRLLAEMRVAQTHWEGQGAYLVSLRDITQQRVYEDEIRRQKQRLEDANRQLQMMASSDPLTGLKNRRALDERLKDEFRRARLLRSPLSLVLLDVDHFKQFNDAFGHQAGDDVLKAVGRIVRDQCREIDFAARFGGEEFIVLLPNMDRDEAMSFAEALCREIQDADWPRREITASLGVATTGPEIDSSHALIAVADAALYFSKENGRNQANHTDAIPEAGR